MKLSDEIWNKDVGNGVSLATRVGKVEPTSLLLLDLESFKNVWTQRLNDAKTRKLPDLFAKSQAVLRFISEHDSVVLLMWPHIKTTALIASDNHDVLMLE